MNLKDSIKQQLKHKATIKIVTDCVSKQIKDIKIGVQKTIKTKEESTRNHQFRLKRGKSFSQISRIKPDIDLVTDSFESPLLTNDELKQLAKARQSSQQVYTKLHRNTTAHYYSEINQNFLQKIQYLAGSRHQNLIKKPQILFMLNTRRFSEQQIVNTVPNFPLSTKTCVFDAKKYSKGDILALSKWFKESLLNLNSTFSIHNKQYMQKVYYLYISAIWEYIRIVSLQSNGKSSVLQQFLSGFFQLINEIIQHQHKQSQDQFKRNRSQMEDLKHLLDQNHQLLQERIVTLQRRLKQLQMKYNKLAVVYFSYLTINRQILSQNSNLQKTLAQIQEAYQILKLQHYKLLSKLNQEGSIQEQSNRFYFVNKFNKAEIITHFISGREQYQSYRESIKDVHRIDSQLAKYWSKVEDTFEIQKMLPSQSLFSKKHQVCVQTNLNQLYSMDKSIQNYSLKSHVSDISLQENEHIEEFLCKQINQQKHSMKNQNQDLVITLKQLYEQVYSQNLKIKTQNQQLILRAEAMKYNNSLLIKTIEQERKQFERRTQLLKNLRDQNDKLYEELAEKQSQLQKALENGQIASKNFSNQRLNNQFFVKNQQILRKSLDDIKRESSQQIKDLEAQAKKLRLKIKKACTVITTYLDIIQNAIDKRYLEIGRSLEQIFKDDLVRQQKDSDLFLTKT